MRRFVERQEGRHLAVTRADHPPENTEQREKAEAKCSATQTLQAHRHTSNTEQRIRGGGGFSVWIPSSQFS